MGIGAGAWAITGEAMTVPVAFASGVLIDVDHLVDFYNWYVRGDRRFLLLPLHGWEISVAGLLTYLVWAQHPLLLAAVLGHIGHLAADQLANSQHLASYSIVGRSVYRFDRQRLMGGPLVSLSRVLHANIPMWQLLEPWFLRMSARVRRQPRRRA